MPPNEGNQICAICLSTINEKDKYKLECNHVFHTDCIVQWFRGSNGNCPCCWDNKKKKMSYYGVWERPYIDTRCKKLEKYSKKEGDKKLKKQVEKLNKKVEEYNTIIKERKEFKKTNEYISITKHMNTINRQINNKDRTIMNMKINLISDYPVILTNY
jgi:hypothetical protein